MKTKVLLLLFWLLLAAPVSAVALEAKVLRVRDGDSLSVYAEGRRRELRLYGIDAPELGQRAGKASRRALSRLVKPGDVVDVRSMDTDVYGRIVGVVTRKNLNVNLEMVRRGRAWVYEHFCRASFCRDWKKAQQTAREGRIGLWRDENPTPPWQFRRGNGKPNASPDWFPWF